MGDQTPSLVDELRASLAWLGGRRRQVDVVVVSDRRGRGLADTDFPYHSMTTEFLSDAELGEVLGALRAFGLRVRAVFSASEFLLAAGPIWPEAGSAAGPAAAGDAGPELTVVMNLAPGPVGTSGKLLIPAAAYARGMPCTGPAPYAVGLARQKFHWSLVLDGLGVRVPRAWCFSPQFGWLGGRPPDRGATVLMQPASEAASIGVGPGSRRVADESIETAAREMAAAFRQDVLVRAFISGREAECPLVVSERARAMGVVGVSLDDARELGDRFLDYDAVFGDRHGFYEFREVSVEGADRMARTAERVAEGLGLGGLCRVDFRIDDVGAAFVIDVAGYPHITRHTSFARAALSLGMEPADLPPLAVALALRRDGPAGRHPSDQC